MISDSDILSLENAVNKYWTDVLSSEEGNRTFYNIATGKEGGHQLSDRVDQLSTEFISTTYPLRSGYQKSKGKISSRSMGDIWFKNEQDEKIIYPDDVPFDGHHGRSPDKRLGRRQKTLDPW